MTAVEAQRPVRRGSLLANSAMLSTTALAVSAANYLLNVVLARWLPPAQFGDVSLVVNVVLVGSLVAATLQLVASRATASAPESRDAVRRILVRGALVVGAVTLAGLGGGAWLLAAELNASTPWIFVVLGLGLPVYFVQAVHRGVLQGELRFPRLALSYGVEAAARVGVTVALVAAGFGVMGAAIGVAVSFVASAAVARVRPLAGAVATVDVASLGLRAAVAGATVLLVGQTVVNTADLVISKARFDPATAGVYAAAALVGRALVFLSSSVVSSVFPVVARDGIGAGERRRAILGGVGLTVAIGVAGTLGVALGGHLLVAVAFGAGYAGAEPLLVPYALATALFALANLLASVEVARRRIAAAVVLACGAVAQTAVLAVWGSTPQSLAWLQVAVMGATALAVLVAHLRGARRD
ncbi:MAG: oligosaccharide flippase family protein [Actinobacteria bacterium]|nr:oligosaccharide flippase family protein [Actinomycetota bacterium]